MLKLLCYLLIGTFATATACSGITPGGDQDTRSTLDVAAFKAAVERGEGILVDVRTPNEYASGHIPGSINLDWTARDYEVLLATLDPARPVLLYCAVGGRSDQAREYLKERGYQALDLEDGIMAWKQAGLPVER